MRSAGSAPRSRRWGRPSRSVAAAASGSPPRGAARRARCSRSTATSCSTSTSARSSPSTSASGAAATIVVAQVRSPFGVVDVEEDGTITGFREAPLLDALGQLRRLRARRGRACPAARRRATTSSATFPQLAAEGKLHALSATRASGSRSTRRRILRRADEFMREHPEWRPQTAARMSARLAELRLPRPLRLRAAPGREAVGLGADLGRHRRSTSGRSCSCARASRSRLQFHREKDESWYVAERPRDGSSSATPGRRRSTRRS